MNASYFNYSPETGELVLIDSQTRLFSKSELNYAPVTKESRAFMFGLAHGENLIRNNNRETWVLSDCSSIQHISLNKNFNSRQFTDSIFISSLPCLNIFYVSGKALLLSDQLSRQFQQVYLKNEFSLSKQMSKIIPPLDKLNIEDFTKISSEDLTDYILRSPRQEIVDVWPKKFRYAQPVHKTQLHNSSQNISSELQLLIGLRLGFNNTSILNLPVWKSILESKGDISKSLANEALKVHNLSKIHAKIQSLNLDDEVLQKLVDKYNLYKSSSSQTVSSNYALRKPNSMMCNCQECSQVSQNSNFSQEAFQSLINQIDKIENLINASCDLLSVSCPNEILQYTTQKANLKCMDAKFKLSIAFFQFLVYALNKNRFTFQKDKQNENSVTVAFIPFHISKDFTI